MGSEKGGVEEKLRSRGNEKEAKRLKTEEKGRLEGLTRRGEPFEIHVSRQKKGTGRLIARKGIRKNHINSCQNPDREGVILSEKSGRDRIIPFLKKSAKSTLNRVPMRGTKKWERMEK